MSLEDIERRARELLRSSHVDPDEAFNLVEMFFEKLSTYIKSRSYINASKRGAWNVELMDNAVDEVVDAYGSSYALLDLWESAWETRVSKSDGRDVVTKLLEAIEIVKRRKPSKRGRSST